MGIFSRAAHGIANRLGVTKLKKRAFAAVSRWNHKRGGYAIISEVSHAADMRMSLDTMRNKSRTLAENNGIVRRYLNMCRNNIVGSEGVRFKPVIYLKDGETPDIKAQNAITTAWKKWCARGVCEIAGRQSFKDLQRGLIYDAMRDGEFLIKKITGAAAGNAFGYALQRIDPRRLDTTHDTPCNEYGNAVVMGVEVNDYGRPVAYYILQSSSIYGSATLETKRIPADEIIHGFVPDEFVETTRGVPSLYPVLNHLKDMGEYNTAALLNAKAGAKRLGFFIRTEEGAPADNAGLATGAETGEDGNQQLVIDTDDLYAQSLDYGLDFKDVSTRYPDGQYGQFIKTHGEWIAAGLNVSYNTLFNDLEGVNYSSIRQGVLDEREAWKTLQDWFINAFHEEIFGDWLRYALLYGQIVSSTGKAFTPADMERLKGHAWHARRWGWVDPLKDAQAQVLLLQSKLTSRTRIAADAGNEIEDVFSEIEQERDVAKEYGIDLMPVAPVIPADDKSEDAKDEAKEQGNDNAEKSN
jgi:lambda family phage portal protein